jgi:hypothetical protein
VTPLLNSEMDAYIPLVVRKMPRRMMKALRRVIHDLLQVPKYDS